MKIVKAIKRNDQDLESERRMFIVKEKIKYYLRCYVTIENHLEGE